MPTEGGALWRQLTDGDTLSASHRETSECVCVCRCVGVGGWVCICVCNQSTEVIYHNF